MVEHLPDFCLGICWYLLSTRSGNLEDRKDNESVWRYFEFTVEYIEYNPSFPMSLENRNIFPKENLLFLPFIYMLREYYMGATFFSSSSLF